MIYQSNMIRWTHVTTWQVNASVPGGLPGAILVNLHALRSITWVQVQQVALFKNEMTKMRVRELAKFDVNRRGKKMLIFYRDKNEGTYHSGGEGGVPAM